MTSKPLTARKPGTVVQLSFDQMAGPLCQRWSRGIGTWKHPDQGGFDVRRYEIAEILDDATARAFVIEHHYSHSYPAALKRYGLYRGGTLVGVAVFSAPSNELTLTKPFPSLKPYYESMELGRFILEDSVESNGETHFLAQCFRHLKQAGVRGVVSFADPVARRDSLGRVCFRGHVGHIYMAASALFAGRGTARTLLLLPDGQALSDRTLQKIRAQERGHESAEEELIRYGAQPLHSGEDPRQWLKDALLTIGVQKLEHPGCYRYLFSLGGRVVRPSIGLPTYPYPSKSREEAR